MIIKSLVSIVCPFYNESLGVEPFYQAICEVIDSASDCDFEILCIDDGSDDNTLAQLILLSQKDARFIVVELSRNFGKESALTAGIDLATGGAIILIDADLQDPPGLIIQMIQAWQDGADVVLAKRIDRSADAYFKRNTSALFYRFFNQISPVSIPENVGDFRLMNRQSIDAVKALPERQRFMKGLLSWVGFKTITIEYVRPTRFSGKTKFSGWKLWNFAIDGITSFSTIPLKIWTYIGTIGAFLSLIYGMFIILRTLINGIDVPGYASVLVTILFFGSLQLISVGVLGEYIGRIYIETKQRPSYFIRQIHRNR